MSEMRPFELLEAPLAGTRLIEASAGTGKTYTIAALFLRLILERHLPVKQILVVTFTQAATEELKHRIRTRLREAIVAFAGGNTEDPFLQGLLRKTGNTRSALGRLRIALREFDQAAICTIHSFCLRMLHEHAFESGSLFDTELISDQEDLKREITEDFWRRHFYNASPLLAAYARSRKFTPQHLEDLLNKRIARPYLKVIPATPPPDPTSAEKAYLLAFQEMAQAWNQWREEVSDILSSSPALHQSLYGPSKAPPLVDGMEALVESGGHAPVRFSNFERFTSTMIRNATKKDHEPPLHPFFRLCEEFQNRKAELEEVYEKVLLGLRRDFLTHAHVALSRRKIKENIQSFDDLLTQLRGALKDRGGAALAGAIQTKFKAALIDEFQDTDPIQYEIFKAVFADPESILFLIGDPKRAVYSFWGVDFFVFIVAS
jgi:exodeoxyribonuclease V beta subunit